MNQEIYAHITNTTDTSMHDDIISYAEYIENSGRLSTYFLNAYDRLTNDDENQ